MFDFIKVSVRFDMNLNCGCGLFVVRFNYVLDVLYFWKWYECERCVVFMYFGFVEVDYCVLFVDWFWGWVDIGECDLNVVFWLV